MPGVIFGEEVVFRCVRFPWSGVVGKLTLGQGRKPTEAELAWMRRGQGNCESVCGSPCPGECGIAFGLERERSA